MSKAQNNFPFDANRNTRHTELSHCNAVTKLHEAKNTEQHGSMTPENIYFYAKIHVLRTEKTFSQLPVFSCKT